MKKPEYQEYLRSSEWQVRRLWALDAADRRCQICYKGGDLHVHHRTYARLGRERPADLTVLCAVCHAKHHDKLAAYAEEERVNPSWIATERVYLRAAASGALETQDWMLLAGSQMRDAADGTQLLIRLADDATYHGAPLATLERFARLVAYELGYRVTCQFVDEFEPPAATPDAPTA